MQQLLTRCRSLALFKILCKLQLFMVLLEEFMQLPVQLSGSPAARVIVGCEGGFAYLIAGKYAEDFGVVEESCNPYTGKDGK